MRLLLSAATATALLLATGASAGTSDESACWNRDIERLDHYLNPPEKGDNEFFTALSQRSEKTNVTLVYAAKSSMKKFPQRMYRIRTGLKGTPTPGVDPVGCDNNYLNTRTYFMPTTVPAPAGSAALQGTYNKSYDYPDPAVYAGGNDGQPSGVDINSYYRYLNWSIPQGGKVLSPAVPESGINACTAAATATEMEVILKGRALKDVISDCTVCVDKRGYWLNPYVATNSEDPSAGVFAGRWLRFYPPKWVLMNLAYKRLVKGPLLSQIREGVVGTDPAGTGGLVTQKMLPQSCSGPDEKGGGGKPPAQQKLESIDGLNYTTNNNPLAEMLLNTAWYMAGGQEISSSWHFDSTAQPAQMKAQGSGALGKSGPCSNCAGDFVVLFSDGRGDSANPYCATSPMPAVCKAAAQCTTLGMGEGDGDHFLAGTGATIMGSATNSPSTCEKDYADDVARWMANTPVKVGDANSKVRTYVIGLGDPENTYGEMSSLIEIAAAGRGNHEFADNFAALERNIEKVLMTIIENATSFSAAAITSVQTRGFTSAFIPRFIPHSGAQWEGSLARYQLYNEFAAGCTKADEGKKNARNPNGDSSCNDFYLRDLNEKFVGEDGTGKFVELDTSQAWNSTTNANGWPIKKTADNKTIPATPLWEAATQLSSRVDTLIAAGTDITTAANARKIYTVAPDSDGAYSKTLVPFTVANVETIAPLLKLGDVTGDFCTTLSVYTRNTYATTNDCAADVIRFMHGQDVMRQNPYNRTSPQPAVLKSRPNILGDIFHSTPVLVTPPVAAYLCDLGIANQCVPSLYSPSLTAGGEEAYKAYATTYHHRDQFVLVAANDGMLHAFNAGVYETADNGVGSFNTGTGKELWAFIPPDQLPKLIRYVLGDRHELLVDGSAMVRDVWVDGSGEDTDKDHEKQADEFHTVAVVGEREGGRSFFALDVTDPDEPAFLWASPLPSKTTNLNRGESWNDLGPAAPPIGPIAAYDETSPKVKVGGVAAREQYIVALGGGYDASLLRGRSIHILDVWTGDEVYGYYHAEATSGTDPRKQLFPVAAPVSLIDSDSDGLFDLGVVGDTAGQVWTMNLSKPGQNTGGDGRYDNWLTGRAFVQFEGESFAKRSPFFQRAVAASLPGGDIRIFLGAGDRANIKDPDGGTCGLANLSACVRKNCAVNVTATEYRVGPGPSDGTGGHFAQGSWSFAKDGTSITSSYASDTAGAGTSCANVVDANINVTLTCGSTSQTHASNIYCDWANGVDCPTGTGRPFGTKLAYDVDVEMSRFYSFKLFGTGNRARFEDATGAGLYDGAALSDSDLVNAATTTAAAGSDGWYVQHANSQDERTASSALLLGGCVLWNTLQSNGQTDLACGATRLPDSAYIYQGDAVSGAIRCGTPGSSTYTATDRFRSRSTFISPQQPSPVISVSPTTGEILYSAVSVEPGAPPLSVSVGSGEIIGPIHWLEVPRAVHDCRHDGTCN